MADSSHPCSDPGTLWYHPAFCQMALPAAAPAEQSWRRSAGGLAMACEVSAEGAQLPWGWALRRLLMHLCDRAVRTASPVVELGADASALAAEWGLPATGPVLEEIAAQADRLVASRLTLSVNGQTPLGVLDARAQSRRAAAWRPSLRLNARFHAGLVQGAVPLDRAIVTALAAEALALDAHGWIRHLLHGQPADHAATVAWDELLARFGQPGQEPATFRAVFEDALRMVFAADHTIALAADDAGVTVGFAAPDEEEAPPKPAEPAAAPSPEQREPRPEPAAALPPADVAPRPEPVSRPEPAPRPERGAPRPVDTVSLRSQLTGLQGVVWLRRGHGDEPPVIGVTPGTRFEPERLTTLLLEPLIMQVTGGLPQKEFDAVSAWAMANRDLIDLVWEGRAGSFEEIAGRVKKVPAPGWRQN
jgi:hypothetical protein